MTMQNKLFLSFFTLLMGITLYANDILTDYRLHGLANIEKHMDQELASKRYWINYLNTQDTHFGFIELYNNILVCNKHDSTLCVYRKDDNNSYTLKKKYAAYTGKNQGNKSKEGDLKTPIGLYNLTQKISKIDSFYGPLAFVTSYPNIYDKYNGKKGHGIWIHGLPTDQKRDSFTKGCIAIGNDSIKCLDKHLNISKTILIIDKEEVTKKVSKEKLSIVLAQLYAWRYAWLYNDTEAYLNFYTKNFTRFDGMAYNAFVKYKTRIFKKQEKKKIVFSQINVLPYPQTDNIYKISFKEFYQSDSFTFSGDKTLIVKLINNSIEILTEK